MAIIRNFTMGFGALVRGFGFLVAHPRLWIFAVVPTLINLAIVAAMLVAFIHYYGFIYAWLAAHVGSPDIANPTAWYGHVADALLWVVRLLMQVLLVFVSLILLLVSAYALSLVVAGPFNDALSERVETIVTGIEPPPFALKKFLIDIARVVRVELVKAAILIAIPVALFVVNLIPIVGGPLYVAATLLFGAWDLGFSFADLPAGRRALPFRERWAFAKHNRWALVGLGAGFVIPFFSLLFAAPLVVGGTLLYVDLSPTPRGNRDQ